MGLLAQVQAAVDLAFEAADDLVAEIWITRQQQSSFDPATGDATEIEVEYVFEGVVDTQSKFGAFNTRGTGESGSEVGSSNAKLYLKPGGTDPKRGDVARVDETRYRIERVSPIVPDGKTVLLWELDVSL